MAGNWLVVAVAGLTACLVGNSGAGAAELDWAQWRGPARDGAATAGPSLIDQLPAEGLRPAWLSPEGLEGVSSGGWSSPVVAGGRVYLFAHSKTRVSTDQLPPRRFPYLPPEKRTGMSDAEYEEYERNRRDEEERLSKQFRYQEFVHCLDADTGELRWTNSADSVYTRFFQSGTPAVAGRRLYVLGAGRVARCLDAETGEQLWRVQLPGPFRDEYLQSSFAVADGLAVVQCGQLLALDARTGELKWAAGEVDDVRHSSPLIWDAAGEKRVIANLTARETVCLELATGRELWRVQGEGGHASPVVAGQRLLTYGDSRKKGLRCFQLRSDGPPELEWVWQGAADQGSSPVVWGDLVFVQGGRRLACVDLRSGKAHWTSNLDMSNPRYSSPIAGDSKVFYCFESLLCFAASPEGFEPLMKAVIDRQGRLADEVVFRERLKMDELEKTAEGQKEAQSLWRREFGEGPLPCASPALADGRLYLRLKSRVACYDLRR